IAEQLIKEGMEKGIEKGMKKGIIEGKREVAKKLLTKGLDINAIMEITGLRESEIRKIMH
ncbi:MAG: transposase, partial [Eubacteriaceae bacterium]